MGLQFQILLLDLLGSVPGVTKDRVCFPMAPNPKPKPFSGSGLEFRTVLDGSSAALR